jgi:TP901 family phage tail tape measure protein
MIPTIIPAIFLAKDKMTATMAKMSSASKKFASESSAKFKAAGQNAFAFGRKMAVTGVMIGAPLVLAGKKAVEFEDKLSDIGKTTGLQGKELTKFGDDILQMSLKTRSSIDDLATISEIGGRLGIAKKDLKAFTISANEFAVALGGDFSGGVEQAITQFGKVNALFKDTKNLDIATALKKSGSAFNALSAKGVNVEGLTDFSLRVGALPEAMRPSLASSAALGATLQKAGVDAQIASSGFSNFITKAAQNLPAFASQMKMSTNEARNLLNTDTAGFFAKFAESMKGMPADKMAVQLKNLGLNSLEVQKAVGAMAGSTDKYNELLKISNDQMKDGTSIGKEYNTKNNNTAGQMAKLKNNMMALAITVGNALLPVINELVSALMPYLSAMGKWMSRNKGTVKTIVLIAASISALSLAISGVSFVIGVFQKAMAVGKIAMAGFNLVMSMNPIGLVVAGIVALSVAVYALSKAFRTSTVAEQVNADVRERALEKTAEQRAEMQILFNTLRNAKQGTDQYKNALQKINDMSPGLVEKYKLQEKNIRNIAAAEKDLAAQIMKRAESEARAELLKESVKKQMAIMEGRDNTLNENILSFFGADKYVKSSQIIRAGAEQARQQELSKQIAAEQNPQSANPEQAKQESTLKNVLNINFTGLAEGMQATANGKAIGTSSGGTLKKKFAGTN